MILKKLFMLLTMLLTIVLQIHQGQLGYHTNTVYNLSMLLTHVPLSPNPTLYPDQNYQLYFATS